MDYLVFKSLHIIFVVTWFAGLFYIGRLFIYNTEANEKLEPEKSILQNQFNIMIKRLWFIIAWPSAILTLFLGFALVFALGVDLLLQPWLIMKLLIVFVLFLYHLLLHKIYFQQKNKIFKYTSIKLRIWNEVPTLLLFIIVFIVVFKTNLNNLYIALLCCLLILILLNAIFIYRKQRLKRIK